MKIAWSLTAESYLDQLSPTERAKVTNAVAKLKTEWGRPGAELKQLSGDQDDLFSLRVGSDIRVLVKRDDNAVIVVDVVRRSQIEGLRRVASLAASG